MTITVVSVVGNGSDNDAIVVYRDGRKIGYLAPAPNYGSIEGILEAATGEKPETLMVEQTGDVYPNDLSDIEKWPPA